jgi:GTP-binding protein HflX
MWTHLERMEGAIGTRGPGEKQIEEDRRLVDRRIQQLRNALALEERRRETRSAARSSYFKVSLVGYTNAGKSTLLRELTGAGAFVEDKLFATLDTQTRAWELPGNQRVFLSDTVGFIRDLPHHLVASFHSTLAEAAEADLLLHVVDASSPEAEEHIRVVEDVLRDIGAEDAIDDRMTVSALLTDHPRSVEVSAHTGDGLEELGRRVSEVVQTSFVSIDARIPAGAGRLLALIAEYGNVLERAYDGDEVVLRARVARRDAVRIHEEMRRLGLWEPEPAAVDDW